MVTEVVTRAKEDDIRFVSFQFTDIFGTIKSVTLPITQLEEALQEGIFFDGSSVQGFARIFESDMILVPDSSTYRVLPWSVPERRRARIICDVYTTDGKPLLSSPRTILQRVLERASAMGYTYNVGPELEFFLFKRNGDKPFQPVPHDIGGYFDFSPRDEAQQVRSEIIIALEALGIHVEMAHHEVAAGQHEIDFRYADALTTADSAITLKYTVRAIAATYGIYASFMPKPIFGTNGSGMHTHQSMSDGHGKNVFYAVDDPYHLSKLAYHFLAGQMAHARALAAIGAPTVNSYKRLTPGYEAPVYICWAHRNRSAMIRVPATRPGKEAATRIELRCPDPSSNPYLLFAVMLAAGLDGVERQLEAPEPVNEDIYHLQESDLAERSIGTLPGTLSEALDALEQDKVIMEALGEAVSETFIRAKRAEWDEYRIRVTPWELERYLETA
ncbi:MAG TPA: glutamine synthetase family protein [Anaerolineae bacterium]|nr:glutamine synthetase family protein [Anaerolineae bacterium]HQH38931.1 glutamine synthetase family protein [Anaerolineae bacterium]